MKQYWEIKSLHQDRILLFRMGDFFEMFHDDAVKAAPILGIALTSRNKKAQDETPMCGVPHHSVAGPINKLLQQGLKVAICDQVEDPRTAKGIVKRAVTRVLTPGMVYDSDTLEASRSHYLVGIDLDGLAAVDVTTGEAFYYLTRETSELEKLVRLLPIAEIVVTSEDIKVPSTDVPVSYFSDSKSNKQSEWPACVQLLLSYLESLGALESQKTIRPFEKRYLSARMEISSTSLRHLEIFQTYHGAPEGSLFHAINRTQTAAGTRLLRQRLIFPLANEVEINKRLNQVERWTCSLDLAKLVRNSLAQMGDIERRLTKVTQPQCNARDLLSLSHSLRAAKGALQQAGDIHLSSFTVVDQLCHQIEHTLVEEPPLAVKQGYMIKKGVRPELDELIELSSESHLLIQKMESQEKEKTGINSLKIRYNNVFGYYIEITHSHKDKVPIHYMRKQTLSNAERFCTEELIDLEKKVLSAEHRRFELEFSIYEDLRQNVITYSSELLQLAAHAAELDVYTALAWLAVERKYCRPVFQDKKLEIELCRHPVVEQVVKNFVPNSIRLEAGGCLLLTGPNMAGKSTIMRQVALISLLAQLGSFVPAQSARLPLFEKIFTRIGASDQLSEGLSTFMVEMLETSEMIKNADQKSLVILDEVGRGTSTYDGMSLAQSILEYLMTQIHCMTLFATHYHELTKLSESYAHLHNVHMSVVERKGEIQFLHTLMQGPAVKSYGIHVAKIAGLPKEITERAQILLKSHEINQPTQQLTLESALSVINSQEDSSQFHPILEEMKVYPILNKTPLEVMAQIAKWKESLN